jgi:hypothetical protein
VVDYGAPSPRQQSYFILAMSSKTVYHDIPAHHKTRKNEIVFLIALAKGMGTHKKPNLASVPASANMSHPPGGWD